MKIKTNSSFFLILLLITMLSESYASAIPGPDFYGSSYRKNKPRQRLDNFDTDCSDTDSWETDTDYKHKIERAQKVLAEYYASPIPGPDVYVSSYRKNKPRQRLDDFNTDYSDAQHASYGTGRYPSETDYKYTQKEFDERSSHYTNQRDNKQSHYSHRGNTNQRYDNKRNPHRRPLTEEEIKSRSQRFYCVLGLLPLLQVPASNAYYNPQQKVFYGPVADLRSYESRGSSIPYCVLTIPYQEPEGTGQENETPGSSIGVGNNN